jgi:hypothetical protein
LKIKKHSHNDIALYPRRPEPSITKYFGIHCINTVFFSHLNTFKMILIIQFIFLKLIYEKMKFPSIFAYYQTTLHIPPVVQEKTVEKHWSSITY